MIFSSIHFLLFFLPLFLILYWIAPKKCKDIVLFAGSLLFYAYGDLKALPLLMISLFFNYFLGRKLSKERSRHDKVKTKRMLWVAILWNLGILLVCKLILKSLPLGISFYTFQVMAYQIDLYRAKEVAEESWLYFGNYVIMFPQLLSGPIVRYGEVKEQLKERKFNIDTVTEGFKVFTLGLAAKVLLADRLGLLWQEVQVTGFESISTPLAWIAAVSYSMKIYFDFAGYSIMAVGLGKMFGFHLPENFKRPYMAESVREFYRRWHVTLGKWFCDYVYIPLGGSREGAYKTVRNLMVVWFLTSIWHGSTVNFIIWGMLLCLLILMERGIAATGLGKFKEKLPVQLFLHVYVWAVIPVTWMCFAITDTAQLQYYLYRMFGISEGIRISAGDWLMAIETYWYLLLAGMFCCTAIPHRLYHKFKDRFWFSVLLIALFWLCVWRVQSQGQNPFMYFTF